MDLNTGEPVIDVKGDLLKCDISRAFNQYIDVLLRTPIMEETSLYTWGLPIREMFTQQYDTNWENRTKSWIVQALNPRFEPLINEIKSIDINRDESTIEITVHVTSIYGTENVAEVALSE